MASSEKLKNFNSIDYRVIIISYDIWNIVKNEIETYVLPEQNLIVLNITNKICVTNVYDWIIDTDRKLQIEMGRAYYINTRKTHRTMSWTNDSIHLIMNIPFTNENVAKVFANLQHRH
jgi:hypothetical protein